MSEQDTQQQMQRLQKARAKIDELSREKSRMIGERSALQSQENDLEKKCKEDFDCDISDLPDFVKQLKEESETALYNAEVILGVREGTVKQSSASKNDGSKSVSKATESVDEDQLV